MLALVNKCFLPCRKHPWCHAAGPTTLCSVTDQAQKWHLLNSGHCPPAKELSAEPNQHVLPPAPPERDLPPQPQPIVQRDNWREK